MSKTYLSSHHVAVVADSPLEAAQQHETIQREGTAYIYDVMEEGTGTLHIVDLETERVTVKQPRSPRRRR